MFQSGHSCSGRDRGCERDHARWQRPPLRQNHSTRRSKKVMSIAPCKFVVMAPQSAWLLSEVCRQLVLSKVPAKIPVENLSAAMTLVSLDGPLMGWSGRAPALPA